jgi:hypothetical protein
MKKIISIFIIVITVYLIYILVNNQQVNNKNVNIYEESKKIVDNTLDVKKENNSEEQVVIKEEKPKIDIGLYLKSNSKYSLVSNHLASDEPEQVIGLFFVIPSNESMITGSSFVKIWNNYTKNYLDISNYKIGYNLKFTLKSGEEVNKTILSPDDAYEIFPKVMVFLYDDVNLIPGKKYYHVTQPEMKENTKLSSIKLVGDVETKNIISDIELTAFMYKDNTDFDAKTGKYIGKSLYTTLIKIN